MEAAVLRVKRKRGADPAEALLISCKRLRVQQEEEAAAGAAVTTQVFRLAATVSSQNESLQKYVREAISRDRAVQMLRPSLGSTQRIQRDLRVLKDVQRQHSRYRVVSKLRPTCGEAEGTEDGSHQSPSPDGDHLPSEPNTEASAHGKDDKEATGGSHFQLFDMVQEELDAPLLKKESNPETILCNSVKMIREHLAVSDESKGLEHRESSEEFVYDIYYAEASKLDWIQDILSVQPYTQEHELVPDDPEPEEVYEDEDDENEESNWRNDYPDEEDSDMEERYQGYYEDSDEEDAWSTFRRHNMLEKEDDA
ncbi:probable RNA polymerase II nuclear localization protein SLC7A6OS [Spea bombifrons]|uniref:probable RNA polymerase II nuclear localization protein SLC7A6OS n=1 Tax=Spea bombifrons TaxID=233779 RepID=UPI002349B5E7|nr:probable RNA polymerase II nuclear localization protein SLC7A6OS [Spea bombifrons]